MRPIAAASTPQITPDLKSHQTNIKKSPAIMNSNIINSPFSLERIVQCCD